MKLGSSVTQAEGLHPASQFLLGVGKGLGLPNKGALTPRGWWDGLWVEGGSVLRMEAVEEPKWL